MSQDNNPPFNEIENILAGLDEPSARKHNTVPLVGPDERIDGPVRTVQVDTYESPDGDVTIALQEAPEADPPPVMHEEATTASQDTPTSHCARHQRRLPHWLPHD